MGNQTPKRLIIKGAIILLLSFYIGGLVWQWNYRAQNPYWEMKFSPITCAWLASHALPLVAIIFFVLSIIAYIARDRYGSLTDEELRAYGSSHPMTDARQKEVFYVTTAEDAPGYIFGKNDKGKVISAPDQ